MQSPTVDFLEPGVHTCAIPPGTHRILAIIMGAGGGGARTPGEAGKMGVANVCDVNGALNMDVVVGHGGRGARTAGETGAHGGLSSIAVNNGNPAPIIIAGGRGSADALTEELVGDPPDGECGSVRIVPFIHAQATV
jgi:hypothetical protein